jgi:flagellar assembly protein FliH
MNMSPDVDAHVLRGTRATDLRAARVDAPLRKNHLLATLHADARVADPRLEAQFDALVEQARQEARAAGWQEGLEAGLRAAARDAQVQQQAYQDRAAAELLAMSQSLQAAVRALAHAADALDTRVMPSYAHVAREVADMVIALAETVVARELTFDSLRLTDTIATLVAELPMSSALTLIVSPESAAVLNDLEPPLSALLGRSTTVIVEHTMTPGDVRVCSGATEVRQLIAESFERIRIAMTQVAS